MVKTRKKLIEVSLPLDAINIASAREKSIRHGHPSTLHLWWARRPLAAARAVIFSQMVDDPSSVPEEFPTEEAQEKERQRLFRIIEDLVLWVNTTNEKVIEQARKEIERSWRRACEDNKDHPRASELFNPEKLPAFHDPFAGGGALPLEAQRLGLESHATDLNPVAVLINKAMIEIPPKFGGLEPVNPEWQSQPESEKLGKKWKGAEGLAEDVHYYGKRMQKIAMDSIGYLYPKIKITVDIIKNRPELTRYMDRELTVIAWLWARTVRCQNPACSRNTPLLSSFALSTKKNKSKFLKPDVRENSISFAVSSTPHVDLATAKKGYKRGTSGIFECAFCGSITTRNYVSEQAKKIGLGAVQTAVVVEGDHERIYLPPKSSPYPENFPQVETSGLDINLSPNPRDVWCRNFGLYTPADLFSKRQIVALTTFSGLVNEISLQAQNDAKSLLSTIDTRSISDEGNGALAYGQAIAVYLAIAIDKAADYWSTICSWHSGKELVRNTFGRQAIPMTWDYTETNPFSSSTGNALSGINWAEKALRLLPASKMGMAQQQDAQTQTLSADKIVSTDPPYYDNIGYADLSDFFYVWLRKAVRSIYPELFSTMAVPKNGELVVTSYRHSTKSEAEKYFLKGMTSAMHQLSNNSQPAFPVTIYYAFKQAEKKSQTGVSSTGWETFLEAVIQAGFSISGTWPLRTELANRMISSGTNALASSVIIVCRARDIIAPMATRKEFRNVLKSELPACVTDLQASNIAPVDLAQASIGPGMEIFTRFNKILDASGEALKVRDALVLINEILDEILAEQEGDFGPDTRWALAWYDQVGFKEGEFGLAETLSKAKNTSVDGLVEAGFLRSHRGKVRLLLPEELQVAWDPLKDNRLTEWEIVHHLIRLLAISEAEAAATIAKLGSVAESARELAYRLYSLAERKKRSQEALQYNMLVQSWPELIRLAEDIRKTTPKQSSLFEG